MKCMLSLKNVLVTWINLNLLINLSDGFKWISRPSSETLAHVGSTVHITWHYNCDQYGISKIYYNGTPIFSRYANKQNYSQRQNVDAHFSVIGESNVTIIIPDVDKDKRGSYCCDVDCNELLHKICTTLFTYALPRITYISPNLYGEKGDTKTLKCNVSGDPAPNATWIHKDTNTTIAQSSVTSFNITGKASGGKYCCHVSNGFGNDTNCTSVQVITLPHVNFVTSNLPEKIKQGDSITLRCNASGDPAPHVTWIHQDTSTTIAQSFVTSFIIISKESGGVYCCRVSNDFGDETNCTTLQVTEYGPINTELTSNVNFTVRNQTFQVFCTADAFPPATYLIQQGDERIVNSSDGNITMSTPVNGSSINITCVAKNKYGEGKLTFLQIPINPPSLCEKEKINGGNRLQIIIVVIVGILVLFVLILTIILGARQRKNSKREVKGARMQHHRRNQLVEESPYGEPVDAIYVRTCPTTKDTDYATVEETGYKRGITNHAQKPQCDKASSAKKAKPTDEAVYAKVDKKSKKKNTSTDMPLNSLYAEIPASLSNAKCPSTQLTTSQQETPASNNDEDGEDSGQESWFSSGE